MRECWRKMKNVLYFSEDGISHVHTTFLCFLVLKFSTKARQEWNRKCFLELSSIIVQKSFMFVNSDSILEPASLLHVDLLNQIRNIFSFKDAHSLQFIMCNVQSLASFRAFRKNHKNTLFMRRHLATWIFKGFLLELEQRI